MGTTAEKGARVLQSIAEVQEGINNLGGSLTDQTPFKDFKTELDNIYDNLPKTSFQEGTEVTIEGGLKGKLDFDEGKVGFGQASQESTKGYNIVNTSNFATTTINGVTCKNNGDGTFTINGTATADTNFNLINGNNVVNWNAGTYKLLGQPDGDSGWDKFILYFNNWDGINCYSGQTKTLSSATTSLSLIIRIGNGKTYNNLTFFPMITTNTSLTNDDCEKYTGGQASPSPNWEQPIQCVTGNQEIVESGKNLFEPVISIDGTQIVGNNMSNLGVTDGEFSFTANGADAYFGQVLASGSTYTANRGIKIYKNGNEKISYKISNTEINRMFITAYDSNGISLGYTEKSGSSLGTYTFPTNCEFVTFRIGKGNAVSGTIYKFNVMVAYGDTIPDYEPYHTPITYPISLGNNKFYSIGDYADELLYDVENDKVYKKAYIEEIHLTKNINWIGQVFNNVYRVNTDAYTDILLPLSESTSSYVKSNMYIAGWATVFGGLRSGYIGIYTNSNIYICTHFTTSNMQGWKDFLDANDVVVVAPRKEPLLTELTDTTLHQQVKNWYYAKSYNGTTIIESNGDLPMIIKVRALKGA